EVFTWLEFRRVLFRSLPGADLLVKLIEFLRDRPEVSMAGLLEHWRETPGGPALHKLAGQRLEIPEDGMAAEFRHVLDNQLLASLRQRDRDRRLAALQGRRPSDLSEVEKAELRVLLGAPERGRG